MLIEFSIIPVGGGPHTTVKVEDDAGETGKLARNVASVEEKAGVAGTSEGG